MKIALLCVAFFCFGAAIALFMRGPLKSTVIPQDVDPTLLSSTAREEWELRKRLCVGDVECWRVFPISEASLVEMQELCSVQCPTDHRAEALWGPIP